MRTSPPWARYARSRDGYALGLALVDALLDSLQTHNFSLVYVEVYANRLNERPEPPSPPLSSPPAASVQSLHALPSYLGRRIIPHAQCRLLFLLPPRCYPTSLSRPLRSALGDVTPTPTPDMGPS